MQSSSSRSDHDTASKNLDNILRNGVPIKTAGNEPILLTGNAFFYAVEAGELDLFAVRLADGRATGARSHLFQARPGELIFETDSDNSGAGIGLLAVGRPGTTLLRFEKEELQRARLEPSNRAGVSKALDQWVEHLSTNFTGEEVSSEKHLEIGAESQTTVEDGSVFRTPLKVVWIQQLSGQIALPGGKDSPKPGSDALFPLSKGIWLQAEGTTLIRSFSTLNLPADRDLWHDIQAFHGIVLRRLQQKEEKTRKQQRSELDRKMAQDKSQLRRALLHLSSSLLSRKELPEIDVSAASPLIAACRVVADAAGIDLNSAQLLELQKDNTQTLDDVARIGNFFTRKVILRDQWWEEDNGPLLAYDGEDNRPLALIPVSPRRYEMVDPSTGTRSPVTGSTGERLAPFAHMFYRPFPAKALTVTDLLKYALRGSYRDVGVVLGLGLLGGLLGLLIPIMTGVIVDSIIPTASRGQLFQISMILLVSVCAIFIFDVTKTIATVRIEGRMDAHTQSAIMDRLLSLPVPFFRRFTAGDLANRSIGINAIRRILSGATLTTLMACAFSSLNLVLLFWYEWKLALVGLGMTLTGILVTSLLSVYMVRYQRSIADIEGKNYGIVLQLLTGIDKLRVTGAENRAFAAWADSFGEKKAIAMKAGKINAAMDSMNSFISLLSTMLIFAFYAGLIGVSAMSTGDFLAFSAAYGNFQNAMLQTTLVLVSTLHVIPLFERAKPVLQTLPEVVEKKGDVITLSGRLQVDHVKFRYTPEGPLVVKDLSMQASPGDFVAIVGGSGAGKSTLLRLLLGFEKPDAGSVYYDGQDLQDLDVREVRRQMGVVLQNGQVQSGDMFSNIIGTTNLTEEDAWQAAEMVGLADDIKAMPMGMQTMVSPGGGTLSGGQRQRILIARAIVRRPKILFFDEATSALDNRTQSLVTESIDRLQVTRIVIAHRLSTIMHADRIYVLQHGEIIESGNYRQLMDKKGFFYELAKRQIA